jgi:hypothetical protein
MLSTSSSAVKIMKQIDYFIEEEKALRSLLYDGAVYLLERKWRPRIVNMRKKMKNQWINIPHIPGRTNYSHAIFGQIDIFSIVVDFLWPLPSFPKIDRTCTPPGQHPVLVYDKISQIKCK